MSGKTAPVTRLLKNFPKDSPKYTASIRGKRSLLFKKRPKLRLSDLLGAFDGVIYYIYSNAKIFC